MMVPLKYLSTVWRTLEMPLINCEINLILTWSSNGVLSNASDNQNTTFGITDTKPYVPVLTLSTEDNAKLLQQLKAIFIRTINWNEYYQETEKMNVPNPHLDYLIDPCFQGINKLFALPFNALADRIRHSRYYLPTEKVKDYNFMIDGKSFFDESIQNDIKTFENIRKFTTGQGDDYTTGFLLDYSYFEKQKMTAIDLSQQKGLDSDPKAIKQNNFTGIFSSNKNRLMFFIISKS